MTAFFIELLRTMEKLRYETDHRPDDQVGMAKRAL